MLRAHDRIQIIGADSDMEQANAIWNAIKAILIEKGCLDQMELRPGSSEQALRDLEQHVGVALPGLLRDLLLIHDGQAGHGLLLGWQMLSADAIRCAWDGWRNIDEADMNADCAEFMASEPPGTIKPMYTNSRWIPLTHDAGGNHHGLDFDPDLHGTLGQLIVFGSDEDTKVLIAHDFAAFMARAIQWLRDAHWDGEWLENPDDEGHVPAAMIRTLAT